MRSILLLLFLLLTITITRAQQCQGPGRTAATANAVCGNLTFKQGTVSSCTGSGNLPNASAGCGDIVTTDNSVWYKFHCYQSGTFGFLLTPQNGFDDYDWEIMDVTGRNPNDVYVTDLRVSLNLSGVTGPTGCTAAGISDVNCGGGNNGTQFNRLINLVAGSDYLMMVNNWSSSGAGYDINFSGTAVLTDNATPTITNVGIVGCDASKLRVTFSEDILCNTITTLGTEFTISNGPHVINGIVSDCSIGANAVPSVIIDLQTALMPGAYTLTVGNGLDGNTFENVCRRLLLPATIGFNVGTPTPLDISNVAFTGCAPNFIDVSFSKPFLCSSLTAAGTEFTIAPVNVPVTLVTYNCVNGRAGQLRLYLQNPIPHGNYQLVVNAGADGNTITDTCGIDMPAGYSIPLVIPQTTTPPVIQTVVFDECHPDKLVLNFDKPVSCFSLSANGSEFSISPGIWPIASMTANCAAGYTSQVTLTLQNPLPANNFSVDIANGGDGNSLSDTCYAFIPAGYSKAFVTTQAPAPIFDSVQFDPCLPTTVKIFYSNAIACSSISADGSEYSITGPAAVTVTGAITDVTCSQGYTNWVLLSLSQPMTVQGNYTLHNGIGSDVNGIRDTCSAFQNVAETLAFTVLGKTSANFTSLVKWGCGMDTIVFAHPGGNGVNSWRWTFSDGVTANGQTVTHEFPITEQTVSAQLIVSNGFCNDTVTNIITLGNTFEPGFSKMPVDTACIGTPVNFTDTSKGSGLQYLWQFGDMTQFIGQNPPPHVYAAAGTYTINLICTDSHGCRDTASSKMEITALPSINFTGLAAQYCTGTTVSLTRSISRNIDSYTWDNGNGLSLPNRTFVQFSYPTEGVYTITLTGNDKYCGAASVSKTVPVYQVPVVELGNDTVLCPAAPLQLGVPFTSNYNYTWNTGAITPQVLTDIFTRYYSLTVDNHGCRGRDDINVKILPACLIKVPTAFTPNKDGVNDQLKAVNADLATNFSLMVYNRMGQLIFKTNNPLEGWDGVIKGNPAETGTYVWQLQYIDPWNGNPVMEKGTSVLIR